MNVSNTLSTAEKIRLENIKRNEEFLTKVGLSPITSNIKVKVKTNNIRKKKNDRIVVEPSRKSRRIEALPVIKYDPKIIDTLSSIEDKNDNDDNDNNNIIEKVQRPRAPSGPRPAPSSDMSRAINAQLSDVLSSNLGQHVSDYGKAAVMAICNGGSVPRFSKYSGVVEWKNAIFLWVNLGQDKSQYPNTFSKQGKYITWYGGSKMHEESEVIKRLIKIGQFSYKGDDQIILFVRKEGENYVCLGKLAHVDYNLDKSPVTFRWQLLNYDSLKNIEYFKSIINL